MNFDKADIPRNLLRGWNALVVDDDPISLEVASDTLAFFGVTLHTAADGEEGLARARDVQPDFIIADIRMPVMDGWGLIEALKDDPRTVDIPVVALTAYAMKGDRERAIAAGFHYHVSKPLDPLKFMQQVMIFLQEAKPQEMAELIGS